jgi:hypothetical protein
VVVPDLPPIPLEDAYAALLTFVLRSVNSIAAANAADTGICVEVARDRFEPIRFRCGVVVCNRDDVATHRSESSVEGSDLAWYRNANLGYVEFGLLEIA